jgi:hypothetical protein
MTMLGRTFRAGIPLVCIVAMGGAAQAQPDCAGQARTIANQSVIVLERGGVLAQARLNINIDGSGRAYNWDNLKGLIHLCNAAKVHPADGTPYQGSVDNATCTGRFMTDVARIKAAGWTDATVGAVEWYGVVGTGSATVNGRTVNGVTPAEIPDSGGFLVSPTTLEDPAFPRTDQRRYVEPLTVATAVILSSGALRPFGVVPGTLGVAWRKQKGIAVPFIVSDLGPRIGEGSPALARRLAGLAPKGDLTRAERFQGQVDTPDVTWVFFGGPKLAPPYSAEAVEAAARAAFEAWGGLARLQACASR